MLVLLLLVEWLGWRALATLSTFSADKCHTTVGHLDRLAWAAKLVVCFKTAVYSLLLLQMCLLILLSDFLLDVVDCFNWREKADVTDWRHYHASACMSP